MLAAAATAADVSALCAQHEEQSERGVRVDGDERHERPRSVCTVQDDRVKVLYPRVILHGACQSGAHKHDAPLDARAAIARGAVREPRTRARWAYSRRDVVRSTGRRG